MPNRLIFGVFWGSESNSMLLGTHFGCDLHRRNYGGKISHAHQIVSRASEGKDPVDFANPTMAHLPHQRNRLQPAKAFFDPLPLSLAHSISRVPCGAAINRASPWSRVILRHLGRHPQIPALGHKPARVEPF